MTKPHSHLVDIETLRT